MKGILCAIVLGAMLSSCYAQQADKREAAGRVMGSDPSPAVTPSSSREVAPPVADSVSSMPDETAAATTRIQEALGKDPIFHANRLKAAVSGDGIELSGDVASGRDRLNAERIAQSYAQGRKVVNHIVVKGHSAAADIHSSQAPPDGRNGSAGSQESTKNESGRNGPP